MERVCTFGNHITREAYGGKAYWLNWLHEQHMDVPETLFIPIMARHQLLELEDCFKKELQEKINELLSGGSFAVRSSAVDEDDFAESKAGYYHSYLEAVGAEGVWKVMTEMGRELKDGNRLGIIVQKMQQPEFSGVIFSSDPKNGNRSKLYICTTLGIGEQLMAGLEKGEELEIIIGANKIQIPKSRIGLSVQKLKQLVKMAKRIEKKLNFPVDIEWCIDKDAKKIILLQCRPMTGIFTRENGIIPITEPNMSELPSYLVSNDKIMLRKLAKENHFAMSNAYLMVCNCQLDIFPHMDFTYQKPEHFRGYSVVLVSPSKIDGKIQRFFIGDKKRVHSVTKCHRFGVRKVASYAQVELCLADLYQAVRLKQWACSAIIQEILDAKYTGVAKRIPEGYVIEIAKGHFLSKGFISMSAYVMDFCGRLLYCKEIWQNKYISITEGCVLEYRLKVPEKVAVPESHIKNLITSIQPLLVKKGMVIEFGMLNDGSLTPYVIDCMQEQNELSEMSLRKIEQGILSSGRREGMLVKLELADDNHALNAHFYNEIADIKPITGKSNYIFYAQMPSIQLLDILNRYDSKRIGFVFKEGSMLCHFAVLLRERGIPAIRGIMEEELEEGEWYEMNTMDASIRKK